MEGAFIVFVPLPRKEECWVGATVQAEVEGGVTAEEVIRICKAEDIVDGSKIGHWKPDEDFCAVLPCDDLSVIGSKVKLDVDPMFFGLSVMNSAFIFCKFQNGKFFPFNELELPSVAGMFQQKQELWRNRIQSAEPDVKFQSLGDMIQAVNDE